MSRYLKSVAPDADENDPFEFTLEQLRFILWWYAIDTEGKFIYQSGTLQRLKGWGKDPLLAVMSCVEFVGPCRFSHWQLDGRRLDSYEEGAEPVAKPHPRGLVQIAAVTQEQTNNTTSLFSSLMGRDFIKDYGVHLGIEKIRANRGRSVIQSVTSNPEALQGNRVTFVVLNETQHWWPNNKGHRMYMTLRNNAAKIDGRALAITNAYLPGEDSVAEIIRNAYEDYLDGRGSGEGLLYDSIEAHEKTPLTEEALREVLPIIRGDAEWLDVERLIKEVLDPTLPPWMSRRMWLNQVVTESDQLHSPSEWKSYEVEGAELAPGDEIVLGMDGGRTDDATVLVAIRVSDNVAFVLGHWEAPDGPRGDGWVVPYNEVDGAVSDAHRVYNVLGFYSDVALWESWISQWDFRYSEKYQVKSPVGANAIGWDMRRSLKTGTEAHERLLSALHYGHLKHDGDVILRRHALNSMRYTTQWGVYFTKKSRETSRKNDAYAALLLAHECLSDYRSRGRHEGKRSGRGYFL